MAKLNKEGVLCDGTLIFCKSHSHCRELFRLFDSAFREMYPSYASRPYAMFHAGTDEEIKDFVIKSFSEANGIVRILFATNAFGMGVN